LPKGTRPVVSPRQYFRGMPESQLPEDIARIIAILARKTAAYGGHLPWEEEQMLKSDLMISRRFWSGFDADDVRRECFRQGIGFRDTGTITDLVARAQAGRELRPHFVFRGFRLAHDRPR